LYGCLAKMHYHDGKVIVLKDSNYHRAFVDFPVAVVSFQQR
jgi:hypothetical protein